MAARSYPLDWPAHVPRTRLPTRSKFRSSFDTAQRNVVKSLRAFASETGRTVSEAIVSSNVSLLETNPRDAGVAVWFTWDGASVCIPCDRYGTPHENLQAIHYIIEARVIEARHGSLHMVRATFTGLKALPAPHDAPVKRPWWVVLGLSAGASVTKIDVEDRYKIMAKKCHPDVPGGSTEAFQELQVARQEALADVTR